jgi:hypothetical protein
MAAWENDHQAILDHAAGLGYSRHTGISYPPVSSSDPGYKNQWISWADGFNAWKAAQIASGNPIWASDPGDGGGSGGGEGGGGGGTAPSTGPVFTPLDLSAPGQNDYWNYYPQAYTAPDPAYPTMGLLSQPYGNNVDTYQPWSQQYGSSGLIPDNLWNYNPPSLPGPGVSYFNANPSSIGGSEGGGTSPTTPTTPTDPTITPGDGPDRPGADDIDKDFPGISWGGTTSSGVVHGTVHSGEEAWGGTTTALPDKPSVSPTGYWSGGGWVDTEGGAEGDSDTGSTPGGEPGFKG